MAAFREMTEQIQNTYAGDDDRPLRGYTASMAVYATLAAGVAAVARWRRQDLPERPAPADVVLIAAATHKLSRILTKDAVTSPLRAPFTQYVEPTGDGEVREEVRGGHGVRHAAGELLTCPFCLAMWTAGGFTAGLVFSPRFTRYAAATLTAVAASDFLQLAYDAAKKGSAKV
ncbi:MAG: hypothetical protein JWN54_99 [Mycobacterium sp.]|nr:hypothetical protein [Mycobacterium sp.]